jgi:ribosome biogenesis GTPase / thiamine phosphate phosphatase
VSLECTRGACVTLEELGWTEDLAAAMPRDPTAVPARVSSVHGVLVDVWTTEGQKTTSMRGTLRGVAIEGGLAVGDWVALAEGSVIAQILPRRTVFLRQAAGEREEAQVIAANVDRVFVVTSVEGDFNVRRLERYLLAVAGGGAEPIIVLTKADLLDDPSPIVVEAKPLARVVVTSALRDMGIDDLRALMPPGSTSVLVGSSGVGKSALVNRLLGKEVQREGHVRAHDKRGRHTTTRRELFALPNGGLVVDTPGMRELKVWQAADEDSEDAFEDVFGIAAGCKYRDCRHANEPGCAVREAIGTGALDPARVASFHKLEAERARKEKRRAR